MLLNIDVERPDLPCHKYRTLHLQCDTCNVTWTCRYKRRIAERSKHYCSRVCGDVARRHDPSVPRLRQCVCRCCGNTFERIIVTTQPDQRYCSGGCAAKHLSLAANMHKPEVQERAKASNRIVHERWRREGSPTRCQKKPPKSIETRNAISLRMQGEHNPFYGRRHTDESRMKMRDSRSKLILAGKMNWSLFGHKSGQYFSIKTHCTYYFRSSWEEAVMKHLDHNDDVITWEYESLRIPYVYRENKRWYIPDFIVTFADHREMWEVKAREFVSDEKTVLKAHAARQYCLANNINTYEILTGATLRERQII